MASPRSCPASAGHFSLVPVLVLLLMYSFASPHLPRATAFSLRVVSPFRSRTHEDGRSATPGIARRKLASSLPCTNSSLFGYAYAVQLGDGYARAASLCRSTVFRRSAAHHLSIPSPLPTPALYPCFSPLAFHPPTPVSPSPQSHPALEAAGRPVDGNGVLSSSLCSLTHFPPPPPPPPSAVSSCIGSRSLILHWKPQVSRVTEMALQAVALSGAQKGWISVGWSGDGRMSRSDAVVGNVVNYPSNVVALYLAGRNSADVKPAGYDLGRTVLEQGTTGSFVIKFSRRVDDGTVRFDPTGAISSHPVPPLSLPFLPCATEGSPGGWTMARCDSTPQAPTRSSGPTPPILARQSSASTGETSMCCAVW
ncbi:unnamed protein product [Closterium sp. NIES-54]